MENIPWIEKYSPQKFSNIVLDPLNKRILENIIKNNYFPNLLLYGPPGTGKTTTIVNLINKFQKKNNQLGKEYTIHLNASDDRGIDIIRNQINSFVETKALFGKGIKFVILDEVDYMTKNAQQALRYLIQKYSKNIRFCLICNYISRIETTLQNEFVHLRFCNLPKEKIFSFLKKIIINEKIDISDNQIYSIQTLFKSDIRSMINFLQSNQNNTSFINNIVDKNFWKNTLQLIKSNKNIDDIVNEIYTQCLKYNLNQSKYIINLIHYLLKDKKFITEKWITLFEKIIHNINSNKKYVLYFCILNLRESYKTL